jgi:hypothetical protein
MTSGAPLRKIAGLFVVNACRHRAEGEVGLLFGNPPKPIAALETIRFGCA